MSNITVLGEMDVGLLWGRTRLTYWSKFVEQAPGVDIIPLRSWGGETFSEVKDEPILKEWKGAESFLKRLKAEAAKLSEDVELGAAWIERLNGESDTGWSRAPDHDWLRVEVALSSTMHAWLYCGGDGHIAPAGQVILVNHEKPTCAINFGNLPRVHLIALMRRPAAWKSSSFSDS